MLSSLYNVAQRQERRKREANVWGWAYDVRCDVKHELFLNDRGKRYSRASYKTANHNGKDTQRTQGVNRGKSYSRASYSKSQWQRHAKESRRPKASIAASAPAEPPIDCKSQWQRHAKESHRSKASIVASATAEPPIGCKSQWQRHATAQPPIDCKSQWQTHANRPKACNPAKRYSRASYRLQITMAEQPQGANRGKHYRQRRATAPRRQSRQALQQNLL